LSYVSLQYFITFFCIDISVVTLSPLKFRRKTQSVEETEVDISDCRRHPHLKVSSKFSHVEI